MQDWRQIAYDAKDILTVCLAKSIDQSLTAQLGSDWFADFARADALEKVSMRITKQGQKSVHDLDLQALLKFLRFRYNLSCQVLTYYGFFSNLDSYAADDQIRQLNTLLDRLINDFRNRIEAHSRAADIERELSGQGINRIYGYEEAYKDMCKLASIFSQVTGNDGVSYSQQLIALTEKKRSRLPIILGSAAGLVLLVGLLIWLLLPSNVYRNNSTPVSVPGAVTVQPYEVYYKNDALYAFCYVINGTNQTIAGIDELQLTDEGRLLAAAGFASLSNLNVAPGETIQYQFVFRAESVLFYDDNLTNVKALVIDHTE